MGKPRKIKKPRIDFTEDSNHVDRSDQGEELWNADPECKHEVYAKMAGGIKCRCCPGWFCY